jgi:hypothetical protein
MRSVAYTVLASQGGCFVLFNMNKLCNGKMLYDVTKAMRYTLLCNCNKLFVLQYAFFAKL